MRLWDFQTPVTHDLVERLLDNVCHVLSPRSGRSPGGRSPGQTRPDRDGLSRVVAGGPIIRRATIYSDKVERPGSLIGTEGVARPTILHRQSRRPELPARSVTSLVAPASLHPYAVVPEALARALGRLLRISTVLPQQHFRRAWVRLRATSHPVHSRGRRLAERLRLSTHDPKTARLPHTKAIQQPPAIA
jgi:hypothetical protein